MRDNRNDRLSRLLPEPEVETEPLPVLGPGVVPAAGAPGAEFGAGGSALVGAGRGGGGIDTRPWPIIDDRVDGGPVVLAGGPVLATLPPLALLPTPMDIDATLNLEGKFDTTLLTLFLLGEFDCTEFVEKWER
jgi:hypothetical protein